MECLVRSDGPMYDSNKQGTVRRWGASTPQRIRMRESVAPLRMTKLLMEIALTDLQHDLPVILAFLHHGISGAGFIEREDLANHGMEFSG
jgi:hypothetical protein